MEVPLTPELEKFVTQKVISGLYGSATEVIQEGLRLLKERDELGRSQGESKLGQVLEQTNRQPEPKSFAVRPLGQDRGLFTLPDDFNAPLLDVEESSLTSLASRRAFMRLTGEERHRILAQQAEEMLSHYQHDSEWKELEAGR